MKLKISLLATSMLLSACVSTQGSHTQTSAPKNSNIPAVVTPKAAMLVDKNNHKKITLKQIMANPDWLGRAPESWYWGDDGHSILYQQKRLGSKLRDLYQVNLADHNTVQVPLAKLQQVADRFAVYNTEHTLAAYLFENNIYIKTLATGEVKQLTRTTAPKSALMFLTNGQLAYRIDNHFYQLNLATNQLVELADLQLTNEPQQVTEPTTYLAKQQKQLIQFIAKKYRDKQQVEAQQHALLTQNSTVTDPRFYFGAGNTIVNASLSPRGDKLLVSVTKAVKHNKLDIMPNYVTLDGRIAAEPARAPVSDNRQYQEQLFLIDLTNGTKTELAYNTLPGFDEDVLASVRKENYAKQGKKYHSKKTPRHIYLIGAERNIVWQTDGKQVAVMLEAWDNKDRWIATVNFDKNQLVPQHRLHDDAWISWNFNEFGWVNHSNAMYYTSEQSGYSQLYVKPLDGKAQQLTAGQFEVSDVTLTKDETKFVFKANKKHPGIYEIYQVAVDGSNFKALTNLGGMNDYALSPDQQQLLIQHSTVTMPPELYVQAIADNAKAKRITHTVSKLFLSYPWSVPSVVAIPSTHQSAPIYSKVYLPTNYSTSGAKYRAVMFSHGAGYLQNSDLGWSAYFREFMFHSMLAQQGYVVIDMDYRASAGYGRAWRTAIYRHMGKPELEDMRDGVNWLVANAHVDRARVGTYGGSYGGFLTIMSMFKEPDIFKAGAALRLVSDWAYYNHGYTSNILNTPADDPIAYQQSSPIYFAQGLQKPLLINAPMVDTNVYFEDSVRLMQRLIELEKPNVEIAIYPVESHGFKQPSSWLYEYQKIYHLFEQQL